MHYRQYEETRRRKKIAEMRSLMQVHRLPQDELFAAWYVDEGRKDSCTEAYVAYCAPVDGTSPKCREERRSLIEQVTRRAHAVLIPDPAAKRFAAWYVDEKRTDPLLAALDAWRARRGTASSR